MPSVDDYRGLLRKRTDWDTWLQQRSGLPGPRGNLELARAVSLEGQEPLFRRYAALDAAAAPENTPRVFLAFCGVLGLGRLLAQGQIDQLEDLRSLANDPRWRIREAVAMALQTWGEADMPSLLQAMRAWADGTLLEQRAAVAALCEPRLLHGRQALRSVLAILDRITQHLARTTDRRAEPFRILRQALGYGWSVALAADLDLGQARFERWVSFDDDDIRWLVRQNLSKNRLCRADPAWVRRMSALVSATRHPGPRH